MSAPTPPYRFIAMPRSTSSKSRSWAWQSGSSLQHPRRSFVMQQQQQSPSVGSSAHAISLLHGQPQGLMPLQLPRIRPAVSPAIPSVGAVPEFSLQSLARISTTEQI